MMISALTESMSSSGLGQKIPKLSKPMEMTRRVTPPSVEAAPEKKEILRELYQSAPLQCALRGNELATGVVPLPQEFAPVPRLCDHNAHNCMTSKFVRFPRPRRTRPLGVSSTPRHEDLTEPVDFLVPISLLSLLSERTGYIASALGSGGTESDVGAPVRSTSTLCIGANEPALLTNLNRTTRTATRKRQQGRTALAIRRR